MLQLKSFALTLCLLCARFFVFDYTADCIMAD